MTKKDEAFKMVQDYFDGLKDQGKRWQKKICSSTRTYTESPADAIARYMIANRDKFAPAVQE